MRIAMLAPGYPTDANRYNWTFVHARAKAYAERDQEVRAFVPGPSGDWTFEGIPATQRGLGGLPAAIGAWAPDAVALHGPYFRLIQAIRRVNAPYVVWVHGHEALWNFGGFRHGRSVADRALRALKTPGRLVWQMTQVRRFLRSSPRVVFVSAWMKRQAELHTAASYPHSVVIPNPVDTRLFGYRWRAAALKHGVTIRSLNSRKYGVDLAIRAMTRAGGADLSIVGSGSLEPALRRLTSRLGAPVRFAAPSIPHQELPRIHGEHGFFVAASRVEAQGVAMCEAMASGLPPVAMAVGGIPEFVTDGASGILVPPRDWRGLGEAIARLVEAPEHARRLSEGARERVLATCAADLVVPRELNLLREAAS